MESRIEPATQAHPDPADRTWTMSYDAAGNQVSVLQPGGVSITNTYDNLNRLVNEQGSGGEAATQAGSFGYDLAGRRTSAGDLAFTFNDRGLLLKTAKTGISGDLSSFGYDANDRLVQRTDASGSASFTWDDADRLWTLTDPVTATTLTYGYDNADRLTGVDYGTSGPKRVYSYDPMDRLTGDTLKTSSGAAIASITYGYDRDDNLTTKTTAGTAGAGTNTYTYDHRNRLTSWTAPGGTVTNYAWDDSGNRIQAGSQTYTYDERNRLISGGGSTYTYTPRGTTASETKDGVTKILQFDAFDRMLSDGEATYTYDALDRVTSRTHGTTVSRYLYGNFANDIIATTDAAGTKQATYSRGLAGEPIGIADGTGPRFAFTDQHGDLIGTFATSATALADSVAYNPFGEETARTGARHDLGYQGELTDPVNGKVNMHARWYQPGTGTFASRDSATVGGTPSIQANRYTYAGAAPLTNSDPTGHDSKAIYCVTCPAPPVENMPGYMCQYGICVRPDAVERWWNDFVNSPGFDYYYNPQLSDEELKRLGYKYMPNGRPVDRDDFWDAPEKVRNAYMQSWSPLLSNDQLGAIWASLNTFSMMEGHGKQAVSRSKRQSTSCFGDLGGVSDKCKRQYLKECHDRGSQRCSKWLDGLVKNPPAWAKDLSHNFLKALIFTFYEMITNLDSPEFKRIKQLMNEDDLVRVMAKMVKIFKTGGKWDHKTYLWKLLGLAGSDGYICVYKSCEQSKKGLKVYYDIFSNIHYGFIMAALGFTEEFTIRAPNSMAYIMGPAIRGTIFRRC